MTDTDPFIDQDVATFLGSGSDLLPAPAADPSAELEAWEGDGMDGIVTPDDRLRFSLADAAEDAGLKPGTLPDFAAIRRADPAVARAVDAAIGSDARKLTALQIAVAKLPQSVVNAAERSGLARDPAVLRMLADNQLARHLPQGRDARGTRATGGAPPASADALQSHRPHAQSRPARGAAGEERMPIQDMAPQQVAVLRAKMTEATRRSVEARDPQARDRWARIADRVSEMLYGVDLDARTVNWRG
ncbi:MAG: hypothetical protein H6842_04660 [Rhodospirillaceae bacterium]|nr:hypothetical protein [Rhodospirillaceae bacterium]